MTKNKKKQKPKQEAVGQAVNKDNSSWLNFLVEFWHLLKPVRKLFLSSLFFILIVAILVIVRPYILKLVIDSFSAFQENNLSHLLLLIVLFFSSELFSFVATYFSDRRIFTLLVDVEYLLNIKAQKKLVFLNLAYHEKENTGAKIIKVERGVDKIGSFLASILWDFVPTILQFVFTLVALFYTDWRIALSFLFFAPLFVIATFLANHHIYPTRKKIYAGYEEASGKMLQSIININAVQSFVQEDREIEDTGMIRAKVRDNEHKQWAWMMKINLAKNILVGLGRATVLLLGSYLVYNKTISIGSLIFVFTLSESAYSSLYRLSRFYDRIEEGREGVIRLMNLLKADDGLVRKEKGIIPKKIEGEIEFKDVSFSYENNTLPALDNIDLKIIPGSITALVGPSGGGKTTIARMVYRHYDPQKGEILLDGHDLRDYDLRSFRKFFSIVPQEVEIFDLSVRDNIAYAHPKASFKEIEAAAKIANVDEFISRLDKGYDTMVGERGIKLSGGQRQRVGIARAILANPRIIIFDEATSSLDSESESLIQDSIKKISKGRTMIIIAHRLSTIRQADKIIVLEKGRVVEVGSHVELKQVKSGLYKKLLGFQIDGEIK